MDINKTKMVILIGASGLVGSKLLEVLINDISIERIYILSRRPLDIKHRKVEIITTDFKNLKPLTTVFQKVDTVYCCIGTTIKKAGSQEAFREVDYGIPVRIASFAHNCSVKRYIVVSSLGADENSGNFYLKTKGEMERDVSANRFRKLAFVRPSLLIGARPEFRLGERIAQIFLALFSFLFLGPLKKYKPIQDITVARAMFSISQSLSNQKIYNSDELHWLGK